MEERGKGDVFQWDQNGLQKHVYIKVFYLVTYWSIYI